MRAILTYHSIDESGSPISISESVFRRQVAWLAKGAVRVVTVETLLRLPPDVDAVALTFDDGFVSFGDVAAPLLIDNGLPATLFVVSGAVGRTNRWPRGADRGVPELPLLGWDALARFSGHGIEIGAHTCTHANLARTPSSQLNDEIVGSAERIGHETGRAPTAFAYPYGAVSDAAVSLVGSRFSWGCTTEMRGLTRTDARAVLPRLDMFYLRGAGQLERWGTARFRYHLRLRAGARLVRSRLRSMTATAP